MVKPMNRKQMKQPVEIAMSEIKVNETTPLLEIKEKSLSSESKTEGSMPTINP